jgi:hypothetical protein
MRSILRILTVALLLAVPVAPAAAAPASPTIEPHLGTITLAPGGPEKITLLWLRITAAPQTEHRFTLTVDHSDVTDFAAVELIVDPDSDTGLAAAARKSSAPASTASAGESGPCSTTASTVSCSWHGAVHESDMLALAALVSVKPTSSAAVGDEGTIMTHARIDDREIATTESAVRVGEGVDLAAGDTQEVAAAAGGTASATPVIRNAGTTAATGVAVVVDAAPDLLGASSYSNCRYGGGTFICTFDDTLAAGGSYELTSPIRLGPPAGSVPGSVAQVLVHWLTAADLADLIEAIPDGLLGDPGTGAALGLTPLATGQAEPQSDTEPLNDAGTITLTVTGSDDPDIAAVGAEVTAGADGTATIDVGSRNIGPGTLRPDLYPNNELPSVVSLPGNVSALVVDPRCDPTGDGRYICSADTTLPPGSRLDYGFALRVDTSQGEAGQVQVANVLPSFAGVRATAQDNNVARIVVTGSGGAGGGLPITGPGALGLAVAGLGLVAAGALLTVVLIRRPVCAHAGGESGRGRRRKGTAR